MSGTKILIGTVFASFSMVAATHAATIGAGLYRLHNHPDGTAVPPPYGLRLDELYDETPDHDIFTFDFDDSSSLVTLTYNSSAGTISIDGVANGGRDNGTGYFADGYQGLYEFHFLYDLGVSGVPGDDDLWVTAPSGSNFGTIATPLGDTFALSDINMDFGFRLGDEDDDLGHRGFAGISGWGWLSVEGVHVENMDWIFTAEQIPEPATGLMVLIGAFGLVRRRRVRA